MQVLFHSRTIIGVLRCAFHSVWFAEMYEVQKHYNLTH